MHIELSRGWRAGRVYGAARTRMAGRLIGADRRGSRLKQNGNGPRGSNGGHSLTSRGRPRRGSCSSQWSWTIDTRNKVRQPCTFLYVPIRRAIQLRRTSHTAICNILREQSSSRDRQCMRSRASQWHLHLYWHGARMGSWTVANA